LGKKPDQKRFGQASPGEKGYLLAKKKSRGSFPSQLTPDYLRHWGGINRTAKAISLHSATKSRGRG